MAESATEQGLDEARETAFVAAMIARAGLKLPAGQIAELVSAYRADRAGFERVVVAERDAERRGRAHGERRRDERLVADGADVLAVPVVIGGVPPA